MKARRSTRGAPVAPVDAMVISEGAAAASLGISPRTLQAWRLRGCGPAFRKLGKRVVYTEADLREYLDRARRTSTSATSVA